jgi:hypothetical protein
MNLGSFPLTSHLSCYVCDDRKGRSVRMIDTPASSPIPKGLSVDIMRNDVETTKFVVVHILKLIHRRKFHLLMPMGLGGKIYSIESLQVMDFELLKPTIKEKG